MEDSEESCFKSEESKSIELPRVFGLGNSDLYLIGEARNYQQKKQPLSLRSIYQ